MQLLEIVYKSIAFFSVLSFSITPAFGDIKCNIVNLSNPDIVSCSQISFERIDKILNEQYKALSADIDSFLKPNLLATQRAWIKLKEEYCVGDDYSGLEGPIERLSCMKQFTSFRLNELVYLRTGVINDGFYKAVSIVNERITAMNYIKAFEYVSGEVSFGHLWSDYAEKNCAMTLILYGEATDKCMARMKFQMPIH